MIIVKCHICGSQMFLDEKTLMENWEGTRSCPNCLTNIPYDVLRPAVTLANPKQEWEVYRVPDDYAKLSMLLTFLPKYE